MNDDEILLFLEQNNFFLKNGAASPRALKRLNDFPNIKSLIQRRCAFLPADTSFAQIIHALKNNLFSLPICPICGEELKFDRISSKYPLTCSRKCAANNRKEQPFSTMDYNADFIERRSKIKKQKFRTGSKKALNDKQWLFEMRHNEHFSVAELSQILSASPSAIRTALKEHNISTPSQQTLREAALMRKYGVNNVGLIDGVRKKAKHTIIEKYGSYSNSSSGERELKTFIEKEKIPYQENVQGIISPYELDIYIPSRNIAIEYCGLYWHSEKYRDKNYHKNKYERCNTRGIRLITIFEDEWKDKRTLVENKIKYILGTYNERRIFARNVKISSVSNGERDEFLNKYHIQGKGIGSITYGLFHDKEMVACATLIQREDNTFELNRYATSCNVIGGFSKILKYFEAQYKGSKIITYADLRWSNGNLYEKTGFILDGYVRPTYEYILNHQRVHRSNFMRKHLPKLLGDKFDPTLTEFENTNRANIQRIWNCGLKRYIKQC